MRPLVTKQTGIRNQQNGLKAGDKYNLSVGHTECKIALKAIKPQWKCHDVIADGNI